MLLKQISIEPLHILLSFGHLRESIIFHGLLCIFRKLKLVLAAREEPALFGIIAREVLLFCLAGSRRKEPVLFVQLRHLHHSGITGSCDHESGPVHELHFFLRGEVGMHGGMLIQFPVEILLRASQKDNLLSG